ncbi:MAG: hypothetical protein ABIJ16_00750 [Bacteroidota bacterium]
MKYFFTALLTIIAFACNNPDEEANGLLNDTTAVSNAGDLPGDFPLLWSMLTQTDSGYIVFYPCDADNRRMELINEEGKEILYIGWGQDATEHQIDSIVKKGSWEWSIYALFGQESFRIDVKTIDPEIMITTWSWTWHESFSGGKQSNSMIMTPENMLEMFDTYKQPCSECWEPEMCTDYMEKHVGHTVKDLFSENAFISRLGNIFADSYSDIHTFFDPEDIIKLQEDRYICLSAKVEDHDEYDEIILVIDLEVNSITAAYAKDGQYLFALSEVEENQYPSPVYDWISERN